MKNKVIVLFIIFVLMLGTIGCSKEAVRPELREAVTTNVDIAVATIRDLSDITYYDAEVLPEANELSFDKDGYVYGIYVNAGDYVEEGEVLATLVGKNYNSIISLEDEIDALEESNKENFKYLENEIELERLSGGDTKLLELQLKHEKEMAELKLSEKRDRLALLQADDIGYSYITAPYDGVAMAVTSVGRGAYLDAGTPICALEGSGKPYIACNFISEKNIESMHDYYCLVGDRRVEVEYVPYPKADLKKLFANSITPKAIFNIKSEDIELKPGDYCAIITVGNFVEQVLSVPINSVYIDKEKKYVFKLEGNVKVRQDVRVGVSGSAYVQILEGLEEGDSVYVKN